MKKTEIETTLGMENLGKRRGTTDASITKRIHEMEDRITGVENTIELMDTLIKENDKCKKFQTENIQEFGAL